MLMVSKASLMAELSLKGSAGIILLPVCVKVDSHKKHTGDTN